MSGDRLLRVLAIEDNLGDARLLEEILLEAEEPGVELATAGSLGAGIDINGRQAFDVVLLDLSLPDSWGTAGVTRLRSVAPTLPIVVLTAFNDGRAAAAAVAEGAQDYLVKWQDPGHVMIRVLRHAIERQRWQERSIESRKLEAIGRLAGAVAHEYNNLMTPVLGYCDILQGLFRADASASRMLSLIREASERVALVTSQLVAFGGGQPMPVGPMHLNDAVRETGNLLHEILSPIASPEMELLAEPDVILYNAGEIGHLLAVMALNAREAMAPAGGEFVVRTGFRRVQPEEARAGGVKPGPHVVLVVRDTGRGMTEAARQRAAEPFVRPGHGANGLNGFSLAALIGTLRAHGAGMAIDSAPDCGATFTAYFADAVTSAVAARAGVA